MTSRISSFRAVVTCLAAVASTVCGRAIADDDIIYCGWSTTIAQEDMKNVNNFTCVQLSNCPANVMVIDGDGNWLNCYRVLTRCFGTCVKCSGASTPAAVCKFKAGETCTPKATIGSSVPCGTEIQGDCDISGTFIGPNGCGCIFGTPTLDACSFNACI